MDCRVAALLAMTALTPTLENLFPTFSTDCFHAAVSHRERENLCGFDLVGVELELEVFFGDLQEQGNAVAG